MGGFTPVGAAERARSGAERRDRMTAVNNEGPAQNGTYGRAQRARALVSSNGPVRRDQCPSSLRTPVRAVLRRGKDGDGRRSGAFFAPERVWLAAATAPAAQCISVCSAASAGGPPCLLLLHAPRYFRASRVSNSSHGTSRSGAQRDRHNESPTDTKLTGVAAASLEALWERVSRKHC